MSKGKDRIVYRRPDGAWANKRLDADKAGSVHPTQKGAEKAAKEMLERSGGGELITKGRDGRIRSKDTIAPGNDPNPPRDREHYNVRLMKYGRHQIGGGHTSDAISLGLVPAAQRFQLLHHLLTRPPHPSLPPADGPGTDTEPLAQLALGQAEPGPDLPDPGCDGPAAVERVLD